MSEQGVRQVDWVVCVDRVISPQEDASRCVWLLGRFVRESSLLRRGLFGHVPAGKHEDGGMTLKDTCQGFRPFDSEIDGIVFDG